MVYSKWNISKKSVSAEGGITKKYIHYCPTDDFKLIAETIFYLAEKGIVTKVDTIKTLEGKKLSKGTKFTKKTQEYKVGMVFQFLLDYSFISKKGIVKSETARGNKPIGYKLLKSRDEFIQLIDNYN